MNKYDMIVVGGGTRLAGFNERLASRLGMRLRTGSVNVSEVRISNSKVSATDMVDVISVLCSVAKNGAQECLTVVDEEPEQEVEETVTYQPIVTTIDQEEDIANEEQTQEQAKPRPKKKVSMLDKLKIWAENFMTENEDDDDYNVYRDDE